MLSLRRVVGISMAPTLLPGRVVLAKTLRRPYQVGDVVIIMQDGLEKVKRVQQIDGAKIFVVGDNEEYSTDSRHFGWINVQDVRGKILWPKNL